LNFNDETRREYFSKNHLDGKATEIRREEIIDEYQNTTFLSKALYYEFLKTK
jgi:hypothetical protein